MIYIIKYFNNDELFEFYDEEDWLKEVEKNNDNVEEFYELTEEEYRELLDKKE